MRILMAISEILPLLVELLYLGFLLSNILNKVEI